LADAQTRQRAAPIEIARFIRGQISSAIATALDWGLMTALIFSGVYYVIAAGAGAVTGAITDFSVKKFWVFDAARRQSLEKQAAKYALVSGTAAALTATLSYGLVDGLHIQKNIGVIIASTIIGFGWNYPMHRLFVFPSEKRRR
jgi:putative flippase GtrA